MEKSKDVKRRFQRSKPFRFSKEQIARLDREEARERRAKELREKEKQRVANKKKKAEAEALAREEQRRRGIPVPTTRYGPSSQPLLLPFFKKGGQASLDHQRALVAEPDLAQPKGDTSTDRTGLGGDPVWDSLDRRIGEPDRDRATRGAAASDAVVISSDEIINGSECSGQGVQGQSSTVYAEPDPEPPSGVRPETVPAWGIAPVFPWNTSTPYSSSLPAPGDLLAYHGEAHCGGAVDDTVEGSTEYGSSPPVLADWDDLGFGGQGSENQAKTGRQAICASTQRGLSPVMPAQSPSFESSQFEPADFFDAEASCGNPGEIGGHAISASTRCGLPPVSPVQGHYVRSSQFNPADLFDIKANCGEPVGIGGQAISASTQRGLSPGSPAQGHYIRSSQFNPDNFSDSGDKVYKMARPPLERFQIGWICALAIEAAAAKEMLDQRFGILDTQDPRDSNTYTLGRIGSHHIVIACLPGGQYGTTSATTVANNMVRTFSKSFRIGLMVGVGGGIPSATHDIRLGDVVISFPEGTSGGVLQYDMGKVGTKGEFRPIGSLNSPPKALLTASNLMRAAELTDDPSYPTFLLNAMARTARTRKTFDRPQQDRLFKLEHTHPTTASTCDGCLAVWEEIRSERETSGPQSHYGIIASGNSVIKDGNTREQLRLNTGALCVEMEAAGLMMDFPCIVVRGICDYADTHKNKEWQGYAALAAASYAKELLSYIPTAHVSQENLVVDVCSSLKGEIEGTNKRLDRAYDQQEQHHNEQKTMALTDQQRRCHQSFKITNYEEQKNINPQRVEGTCEWVLQSLEFNRWWESPCNDLLWVSADPGCGKSVLARSIIDDQVRASSPGVTICFFFFKDNKKQNRLDIALCSVLHQLFSQRPYLLPYALPSWEKNADKLQKEADELWRIFIAATSADISHKTICVFDALDECCEKDQGRLIEKLQFFYHQTTSSTADTYLKFLVTSRPYDHIQDGFRGITDSFPQVHIKGEEENDQIHREINLVSFIIESKSSCFKWNTVLISGYI
ncbi:hypothetical protein LT330_010781 [Penicillium expansum]|nr:hypothetical protein LT330_010781 [Penicillium expansum]